MSSSTLSNSTPGQPTPEHNLALEHIAEWTQTARDAGLRYLHDSRPGLHRKRTAHGFRYVDAHGAPVRDKDTLARIKSLVIPPAWQDVWISPAANGHLQATGRDARGRKQSRYHPKWRTARDETKYHRMQHFGEVLPTLRQRVDHDLSTPGLGRNKVLATIVRLMETTHIRVGNAEYARENKSYGLTTMRHRHVEVHGSEISFLFRGKSGVEHAIGLHDKRLARIIERCHDLPGYELFQYLDHDGNRHTIHSDDVNDYLREITLEHFTAKDFRTWAGTVLACMMLTEFEPFTSASQAKKNIVQAVTAVAQRLGNTPSVCRKCYIHPAILDHYLEGALAKSLTPSEGKQEATRLAHQVVSETSKAREAGNQEKNGLRAEELAMLHILEARLTAPEPASATEAKPETKPKAPSKPGSSRKRTAKPKAVN